MSGGLATEPSTRTRTLTCPPFDLPNRFKELVYHQRFIATGSLHFQFEHRLEGTVCLFLLVVYVGRSRRLSRFGLHRRRDKRRSLRKRKLRAVRTPRRPDHPNRIDQRNPKPRDIQWRRRSGRRCRSLFSDHLSQVDEELRTLSDLAITVGGAAPQDRDATDCWPDGSRRLPACTCGTGSASPATARSASLHHAQAR